MKMNAGAGWLPKPATSWFPRISLFAARSVVSATNEVKARQLNTQTRAVYAASNGILEEVFGEGVAQDAGAGGAKLKC
jgi:hypothetical protein